MIIVLTIDFLSLFILLTIFASFCVRKRDDSNETKFFWKIILSNIFGLIVEILFVFMSSYYDVIPIQTTILTRIYFALIVYSSANIAIYTVFLNNKELLEKKMGKALRWFFFFFTLAELILVCVLPFDIKEAFISGFLYSTYAVGYAVYSIEAFCAWLAIFGVITLIFFKKDYFVQRVVCLILYILTIIEILSFRFFIPGCTILFSGIAILTVFVYFIVANYDSQKVAELNLLKAKAEKMNNEKSDFLSNMSHGIRTNLNIIVGTSNLLIDENPDIDIKEDLKDILYAGDSLLEIVGNILDLNKIESDELELGIQEYNLKKEAENLIDMTSIRIENKPINLVVNIDSSIPEYLMGDKVHIKQVLNNLLTNAFKYTNEGTVIFTINGNTDLINKVCHLTISVKDTGIGIKDTSRLFTKFDRMDMDQTSNIEGTGLGLVITKKTVELMGGRINVDSVYGKGSTFTVILDQKISDGSSTLVNSVGNLDFDFGKRRVLLIDDEKYNLRVAQRFFKKYDFELDSTFSPKEALKLIEKNGYDVIFTDIFMTELPAKEILNLAKKYNIPVIALTADAVSGAEEKYLNEGYADYISKPFSQREIYDALVKQFRK